MKQLLMSTVVVAAVLLAVIVVHAEVKVTIDHNAAGQASSAFTFKTVPTPSNSDFATKAQFKIVDGVRDRNGGGPELLTDGRLAGEEDQPASCFFFNAGTDGGRLTLDLGSTVNLKQVNSYSWHTDTRAPQVYKLYASDGSAQAFDPAPKRGTDPEKAGWKLIASVDSRGTDRPAGGQVGVSISDSTGSLGKFRHLLFDIQQTEDADAFGNTFYTEIDVVSDAPTPAIAAAPAEAKAIALAKAGEYEITIDYTEMPELKDWIVTKLQPKLEEWYPKIVKALPSEGYTAPQKFVVVFRKDMRGVAATAGTRVMCAGAWFKQNLDGEAVGAVVHELVHVAQQYRGRGNPGWLVEGVADYIRWFKFEPTPAGTRPNPARSKYTDSYRITAGFLNYITEKVDKDIVMKMNAAMRHGRYNADLWKEYTGKTVDELWADYIKSVQQP